MSKFMENLAALLKVKTLVTIAVIIVFSVLALRGDIGPNEVMIIISMVVSFYFGTQHESKKPAAVPAVTYSQPVVVIPEQTTPVTASVDNATYSQTHPDSK